MTTTITNRAREVYLNNEFLEIAGPIRGVDPADGVRKLLHVTDAVAHWASAGDSDTALGGVTSACAEISTTAKYPVGFTGTQIGTAFAGLSDGDKVWRVLRSPTNKTFRVADEFTFRKIRPSD